ncbi:hypothetical protein FOL47_004207 [Perkinsus chesapeaki]|uniref:Uncharacterized protein n=1 Tax=Perkinsus chesapeaki TaxID=330153 RepID=A0A7J6M3W2_PERCH|nr:hypothetical protein FOL47_004207 [Perkinsus chesapeaki]
MGFALFDILLAAFLTATHSIGYFPSGEVFVGTVPGKTYMAIQAGFAKTRTAENSTVFKVNVIVSCGEKKVKEDIWFTLTDVDEDIYGVVDKEGKDLPKLHAFISKQCGVQATEETLDTYEFKKDSNKKYTMCQVEVGNDEDVILYRK